MNQEFEFYSSMEKMQAGAFQRALKGWHIHSFAVEHDLGNGEVGPYLSIGYMVLYERDPDDF